ncbi:MAG: toxin-antitoxin system HicB family antitoxin [Pseudomonadota bacterium]
MKNITVRGVDDALDKKLREKAREKGVSINQFVIDALKEQLGLKKGKKYTVVHSDLDHLFGRWSEEEFQRIQGKIDTERVIDKELWK